MTLHSFSPLTVFRIPLRDRIRDEETLKRTRVTDIAKELLNSNVNGRGTLLLKQMAGGVKEVATADQKTQRGRTTNLVGGLSMDRPSSDEGCQKKLDVVFFGKV